jgi:uncharacterized membrane protein
VPSTPLRPALLRSIGELRYRGLYSLIALGTFIWMCSAYVAAPREMLWTPLRHVPSAVMPFAFLLLATGARRNPMLVGADKLMRSEDPARGVIRVTRHPLMWAIILWALAHVAARADLKSLIFFGGLFVLAALGTALMDARKDKAGTEEWQRFRAVTSNIPFVAIAQGRNHIVWREIGWLAPLAGLAVLALFFWIHPWLFGARPY